MSETDRIGRNRAWRRRGWAAAGAAWAVALIGWAIVWALPGADGAYRAEAYVAVDPAASSDARFFSPATRERLAVLEDAVGDVEVASPAPGVFRLAATRPSEADARRAVAGALDRVQSSLVVAPAVDGSADNAADGLEEEIETLAETLRRNQRAIDALKSTGAGASNAPVEARAPRRTTSPAPSPRRAAAIAEARARIADLERRIANLGVVDGPGETGDLRQQYTELQDGYAADDAQLLGMAARLSALEGYDAGTRAANSTFLELRSRLRAEEEALQRLLSEGGSGAATPAVTDGAAALEAGEAQREAGARSDDFSVQLAALEQAHAAGSARFHQLIDMREAAPDGVAADAPAEKTAARIGELSAVRVEADGVSRPAFAGGVFALALLSGLAAAGLAGGGSANRIETLDDLAGLGASVLGSLRDAAGEARSRGRGRSVAPLYAALVALPLAALVNLAALAALRPASIALHAGAF